METIFSFVLTGFATLFLMWLNGKQNEFDRLQDNK